MYPLVHLKIYLFSIYSHATITRNFKNYSYFALWAILMSICTCITNHRFDTGDMIISPLLFLLPIFSETHLTIWLSSSIATQNYFMSCITLFHDRALHFMMSYSTVMFNFCLRSRANVTNIQVTNSQRYGDN